MTTGSSGSPPPRLRLPRPSARRMGIRPGSRPRLPAVVLLWGGVLAAAIVVTLIDYPWTLFLSRNDWRGFSAFMGRSMFEGEGIGGSDFGVCFIGLALVLYLASACRPLRSRLGPWRPFMGFVLTYGVVNCFLATHSLKWIVGRARPPLVLEKGLAYTHWFELGPHLVTGGGYQGSFPSGHTGLAFVFMALAYMVSYKPGASRRLSAAAVGLGLFALGYSLLMAAARSMSLSHWIGDGIFTILLSWLAMHVLFRWVLRVPSQLASAREDGTAFQTPMGWEGLFCAYAALAVAGATLSALGLRCLSPPCPAWAPPAAIVGAWVAASFGRLAWRLRCRVLEGLPPGSKTADPAPEGSPPVAVPQSRPTGIAAAGLRNRSAGA